MKIFIIGNSGCGKSYVSKKLSKLYNIPYCALDNLVWLNNKKREHNQRKTLLENFLLENSSWIIEGMSHKEWMHSLYEKADYIIFLNTNNFLANIRIIKRFFKKKLGIEKGHKENFKSLKNLFKIRKQYQKEIIPEIKEKLKIHNNKSKECKNLKQIIEFIDKTK